MKPIWPAILLVIAASATVGAAEQSSDASQTVAECKRFADMGFEELDADKVIRACQPAMRAAPDDHQIRGLLGRGYLKAGQDEKALQHIQISADKGDVRAVTLLGYMYKVGRGVPQNDEEAVRLYRKAVDGGRSGAAVLLGLMYKSGRGVSQDDREAVRLFRKAAEDGKAAAMVNLGEMYRQGRGVSQDEREAIRLFRKAADDGDAGGMGVLGAMYLQGHGVQQDDREAVRLFRLSSDKGFPRSMYFLGGMYEAGRGVDKDSKIAASHVLRSLKTWDKYARRKLAENPDGWSKEFYLELQRLLKKEGVYSGPFDGQFGLALQKSMEALQRE